MTWQHSAIESVINFVNHEDYVADQRVSSLISCDIGPLASVCPLPTPVHTEGQPTRSSFSRP